MDFLHAIEELPTSIFIRESNSLWAFPMFLFMHTLGMSIVAGGSAMIDLALLGFWPKAPIKPFERLYPLMWVAFGINAVTGTCLLLADASTRGTNPDFWVKMVFVGIGVYLLATMRKKVFQYPDLDKGPVPANLKVLAAASLFCWFCAIMAGRLIAYVGPIAGVN